MRLQILGILVRNWYSKVLEEGCLNTYLTFKKCTIKNSTNVFTYLYIYIHIYKYLCMYNISCEMPQPENVPDHNCRFIWLTITLVCCICNPACNGRIMQNRTNANNNVGLYVCVLTYTCLYSSVKHCNLITWINSIKANQKRIKSNKSHSNGCSCECVCICV